MTCGNNNTFRKEYYLWPFFLKNIILTLSVKQCFLIKKKNAFKYEYVVRISLF